MSVKINVFFPGSTLVCYLFCVLFGGKMLHKNQSTTFPLLSLILISAFSARARSCVTITTQRSSLWARSARIPNILMLFSSSRFPVGSSARINSLPDVKAHAIATLCCSPPESILGNLFSISFVNPIAKSFSSAVLFASVFEAFRI